MGRMLEPEESSLVRQTSGNHSASPSPIHNKVELLPSSPNKGTMLFGGESPPRPVEGAASRSSETKRGWSHLYRG